MRERFGFDWGWFFSGRDAQKELAAYRRIVRVVLATEYPTSPPAEVAEQGAKSMPGGGGGGTIEEEAS